MKDSAEPGVIREAIAHYPPALRTVLQVCRSRGDPGKRTTEDSLFWNFSRTSWLGQKVRSALPFALPPIGLLPTGLEPVPVNTPRVAVLWLLPSFLQVDEGVIHPRDLAQASKGPAGHSGSQAEPWSCHSGARCQRALSSLPTSGTSRHCPPKSLCMAWAGAMMVNTVLIPSTIGSCWLCGAIWGYGRDLLSCGTLS